MEAPDGDDRGPSEFTLRSFGLGVLLSVVLSGANAYLGLFAGMTVSASIPAAVLSMILLRVAGHSTLAENNLVQTAASAGEALAAGAIFTLPALIVMDEWSGLGYWYTTGLIGIGGLLGTIFSVPLRRVLILETQLVFPEGIATAEVLKTDRSGARSGFRSILLGGLFGSLYKFLQTGMNLWSGALRGATRLGSVLFAGGISLSPALLGVGYIVGFRIAVMVFSGGFLGWGIGLPLASLESGPSGGVSFGTAMSLWSSKIRFVGVGAMVVGGIWSLLSLYGPVVSAIQSGIEAYRGSLKQGSSRLPEKRDLPMPWLGVGVALLSVPLVVLLFLQLGLFVTTLTVAVVVLISGFVFSAVAGYMAGLVGSSNNPVSGVTIATILGASLLLLFILGSDHPTAASTAVLCGAVVACAAAISGDTMQDLKAGYEVGTTPWKQQVMEFVGVISAALVIVPILNLLRIRYGIGPPTPAQPDSLPAPQATLMASVAEGVFESGLPWDLILVGIVVGVLIIGLDQWLQGVTEHWRAHVLAVAVGIYLPIQLSATILIGGVVALLVHSGDSRLENREKDEGVLTASGFITGEALVGILLALPVVLSGLHPSIGSGMFSVFERVPAVGTVAGVMVLGLAAWFLYRTGRNVR